MCRFAVGEGDLITFLNIWKGWEGSRRSPKWCYKNFINHRTMLRAADIRNQLQRHLRSDIQQLCLSVSQSHMPTCNPLSGHAAICAGLSLCIQLPHWPTVPRIWLSCIAECNCIARFSTPEPAYHHLIDICLLCPLLSTQHAVDPHHSVSRHNPQMCRQHACCAHVYMHAGRVISIVRPSASDCHAHATGGWGCHGCQQWTIW